MKQTISAPFERVKMIVQCIDKEVKADEAKENHPDDDFEKTERPSLSVKIVMPWHLSLSPLSENIDYHGLPLVSTP